MAMSGIKLHPDLQTFFSDMKLHKNHKFAFFKISDDGKYVVLDEKNVGEQVKTEDAEEDEKEWEKMKSHLDPTEPRYFIYDFRFKKANGAICEKLAFFFWSNDEKSPVKKKMIYASTKDTVKKKFEGISNSFEANELADLDYATISKTVEMQK